MPHTERENQLIRLARLQGSDPGVFVLAVHSFAEAYMRSVCMPENPAYDTFYAYLDAFRGDLMQRNGDHPHAQRYAVLGLMRRAHALTNDVRHRFVSLDTEMARAATQHLLQFCALAGIESEELVNVESYLDVWKERRTVSQLAHELTETGYRLHVAQAESKALTERVTELEGIRERFEHLSREHTDLSRRIADLEQRTSGKDAKIDSLRSERAKLTEELRSLRRRQGELDDAQAYVDALAQISIYTRTRLDYERTIVRLTAEQKQVLSQISLDHDFLVKGAAGTGKTLVLLKAIETAKGVQTPGGQGELDIPEIQGSVALLTYTNTLVKYDRYLSSIMLHEQLDDGDRIATADQFLLERLQEIAPGARIAFKREELDPLLPQKLPPGFTATDFLAELEQVIWARGATREQYVDRMMDRPGMKKAVGRNGRAAVWDAAGAFAAAMERERLYARGFAAKRVVEAVQGASAGASAAAGAVPATGPALAAPAPETSPAPETPTRFDYIFIDEAQDLPAIVLRALKACARRCVLLAGDADQSIYQPGFTFRQAGIDIQGRTRILRTNFRNTVQIHEKAEAFRQTVPGLDGENQPDAFRDGPQPEVFQTADSRSLAELLLSRLRIFTETLGYERENVCVLVPTKQSYETIEAVLEPAGYSLARIRDPGFSFSENRAVRISTLHSAKGLDFPVVLLFLPQSPFVGSDLEPHSADRMRRNLLYVASTRAMDHLNIFTLDPPPDAAIADLLTCFRGHA
ncbi:MAG: 3'-5' exonuclease [Spirochaetaceae bacterium]